MQSRKTIARSKTTLAWPFKCQNNLGTHSIVTKLYTNARAASHRWNEQRVGQESRVAIESPYISGPISNAWQLIALLCCGIYKYYDFNESYFTIHSFFAHTIADAIILYVCKVLKTFNHHLNRKHEFIMIARKTLLIVFDALYRSSHSPLLLTLDIMHYSWLLLGEAYGKYVLRCKTWMSFSCQSLLLSSYYCT